MRRTGENLSLKHWHLEEVFVGLEFDTKGCEADQMV